MEEANISTPKYLPGFEPEELKSLVNSFFSVINESFPDKVIIRSEWNHQWDNAANNLCRYLGYSNGYDFLRAYGYRVVNINDTESGKFVKNDGESNCQPIDSRVKVVKSDDKQKKFPYLIALLSIGIVAAILFLSIGNKSLFSFKRPMTFSSKDEMVDMVKGIYSKLSNDEITDQILITDSNVIHYKINPSISDTLDETDYSHPNEILAWDNTSGTLKTSKGEYSYYEDDYIVFQSEKYKRDYKAIIPLSAKESVEYFNTHQDIVIKIYESLADTTKLLTDLYKSNSVAYFDSSDVSQSQFIDEIKAQEEIYIEFERIIQNEILLLDILNPNSAFISSWNLYKEYFSHLIPPVKMLQNLDVDGNGYYGYGELHSTIEKLLNMLPTADDWEIVFDSWHSSVEFYEQHT